MNSITKSQISNKQIRYMVHKAFKKGIEPLIISELTEGYFNNSYKITLNNNQIVVLKISPKKNVKVLTYENNLMETEVKVNNVMNKLNIPSPKILFYDNSYSFIDCQYFFMTFIDAIAFNKIKKDLTSYQINLIYSNLGMLMKPLQFENNNIFGEISTIDKQYNNWYDCFSNMIFDLIKDANKINLNLPISEKQIIALLSNNKNILNSVSIPCLVHKDLWDGNIFIDKKSLNIIGIIDSERAIYAEPLMEIACGHLDMNSFFINSYLNKNNFSKDEKIRINLYKIYLYLLMIVECPYREYENNNQLIWAKSKLLETYQLFLNHPISNN